MKKYTLYRRTAALLSTAVVVGLMGVGCAPRDATSHTPVCSVSSSEQGIGPVADKSGDLAKPALIRLPVGSITPGGFLKNQLRLMAEGFTGQLQELTDGLQSTAWIGGPKGFAETDGVYISEAPYYIRGLTAVAYSLNDDALKKQAQRWLDWVMESSRPDGNFGPLDSQEPSRINRSNVIDALENYYEATGDEKALMVIERYFVFLSTDLLRQPVANWDATRTPDLLDQSMWVYRHTKKDDVKKTMLALMDILMDQQAPWSSIMTHNTFAATGEKFYTRHIVNVTQGMKGPVISYLKTQNADDLTAYRTGIENLYRDHGRLDGTISGTEMLSGRSSTEGVETCAVAETIRSFDRAAQITGDVKIADELEKVAYNALPAALSPDMKTLSYYSLINQVKIAKKLPGYTSDHADGYGKGPHPAAHCCCTNASFAWPDFINSLYMGTQNNGLAVVAYGPSSVTTPVAGKTVTIRQDTNYPFDDVIALRFEQEEPVTFPLSLRIPSWCKAPVITINGEPLEGIQPGEYATVTRTFAKGDVVEISFPMEIEISRWVNNAVGVQRGPLVYSLYIKENWRSRTVYNDSFADYDVLPASDWNYGILLNADNPNDSFTVETGEMPDQPFDKEKTPIRLKVKAKKIPGWTLSPSGAVANEPPIGPILSDQPVEEVYLVPYGSGALRLGYIPEIAQTNKNVAGDSEAYSTDFPERNLSDFITYGNTFDIQDNALYPVKGNKEDMWGASIYGPKAVLDGRVYSDVVIQATLKMRQVINGAQAGILFRVTNTSIYPNEYDGYYAALDAENDKLTLYKGSKGTVSALASVDFPIARTKEYVMKVEAEGAAIGISIDGQKLLSFSDDSYSQGQVGFKSSNSTLDQGVYYSAFRVTPK